MILIHIIYAKCTLIRSKNQNILDKKIIKKDTHSNVEFKLRIIHFRFTKGSMNKALYNQSEHVLCKNYTLQ